MKLHPLVFVLLLLLTAGAGFGGGMLFQSKYPTLDQKDAAPPWQPKAEQAKADPRRAPLREYLNGKTLTLTPPKVDKGFGSPITNVTVQRDQIEAIAFADSASRSGDEPWHSSVTFVLSTGDGRFDIRGDIRYQEVEATVVFVDFKPTEVIESSWDKKKEARRKSLVEFLDGKPLQDKDGRAVMGSARLPGIFRKSEITAVQFADIATSSGGSPWSTSVTVLAALDGKRYLIQARLEYREVEKSIAIVSFRPTEVSPQ